MTDALRPVVDAVRDGYRLHYDHDRIVQEGDQDLALLTGDASYATGLVELARRGDLHNIGVLAGLIAGSARAHGAGDRTAADALWEPVLAASKTTTG